MARITREGGDGARMKLHQQRTCIGCRTVTGKNELLRWVLKDGAPLRVVSLDLKGSASGRGTWTHGTEKCVRQAVQRKAFARTFRSAVDDSQVVQEFTAYEDQLAARQQSGKHDESGSEI
ncbi:YlxR family protein [Glutamicibacter mishrai]|uniref:YlxR family protein n=2 Tax=Glutamicibacter mishrai TaxID=1775880 RepID=A0A6H0SPQ6_9MICC|nr:YlxR family protein [Glutamicibacter mishrai]